MDSIGDTATTIVLPRRAFTQLARPWLGPLLTVATLGAIILLRPLVPVASPGLPLLLTVAVAAVLGGVAPALLSAALTVLFAAVDASAAGAFFTYTPEAFSRLLVTAIVAPSMAILVGTIQGQRQRSVALAAEARGDQRTRAFTEAASDAVLTADVNGVIRSANPAAEVVYGYPRDQLVGKPIDILAPEARRDRFMDDLRQYIASGEVPAQWRGAQATARHASGRLIPIEVSFGVYGDGPERRLNWIVRDISRRRELEAQVLQASKMDAIGRLAGGVAHDFNNILTAIVGYASLLTDLLPDGDEREMARNIEAASQRAGGLTRQLLAFGRRQMMEPRVLDPADVVTDVTPLIQRIIGEDVEFRTLQAGDTGRIKADPTQLEQVLVNLVVNARDAMPSGGRLTVELSNVELDDLYAATHPEVVPGPHVMLAVSDSGGGIPPEAMEHIFEPFFTTKQESGGTGLGLATVYGIVKQSGGSIGVYSELGTGTVFKVYFPQVFDAAEERRPVTESPVELPGSETILLAEDDEAVRGIAVVALTRAGYRVLVADSGPMALDLAASHPAPIDLLVTDVVMREMSGRRLSEALSSTQPGLRTLYVSGYTENTIVHHGVLEPDVMFLAKPFTPPALVRKIREVLATTEAVGEETDSRELVGIAG